MTEINWGLLQNDPIGEQSRAFNYASQISDLADHRQAAAAVANGDYSGATQAIARTGDLKATQALQQQGVQRGAGAAYAGGDYAGAAQQLAKSGDIEQAQQTQAFGQQAASKGQAYIAAALPVFQQVAQAHANDPDKGAQALSDAFDHIAPEAQAVTGVAPAQLAQFKQQLVSDPQGTIARLQAQVPVNVQNVGGDLVAVQGRNATPIYQTPKFQEQQMGSSLVPLNQAAVNSANGQANPSVIAPQSGQASAPPNGQPLGIRSNNPGNLQPGGQEAVYPTMMHGVLAASNLLDKYAANGKTSVSQILNTWAPPTDQNGKPINNTPAYINYVAGKLGVDPNAPLNLKDNNVKGALLDAVFHYENGQNPLTASMPGGVTQQAGGARIGQPIGGGFKGPDPSAIKNDVGIYIASNGQIKPQYPMGTSGLAYKDAFDKQLNQSMQEQGITANDFASGLASRKADTATLTKMSQLQSQIGTFEQTALKNADLALSLAPKGGAQGGVPLFNRWVQAGRQNIAGDKDVAAFNAALGTFADEYAKVVSGSTNGSGTTDAAKATAESRINGAMTYPQLQSVIGVMKQEMGNRTSAIDDNVSAVKQRLGGRSNLAPQPGSSPAPNDGIPTLSPIAASKLAPGSKFRTTDGRVLTRK